ncbi:hypothetical protein HK104_007544, partial [Borealophlyctis nickersoniae]
METNVELPTVEPPTAGYRNTGSTPIASAPAVSAPLPIGPVRVPGSEKYSVTGILMKWTNKRKKVEWKVDHLLKSTRRFHQDDPVTPNFKAVGGQDQGLKPQKSWKPPQRLKSGRRFKPSQRSKESKVQEARESTILNVRYIREDDIPDNPDESDVDKSEATGQPVIIPWVAIPVPPEVTPEVRPRLSSTDLIMLGQMDQTIRTMVLQMMQEDPNGTVELAHGVLQSIGMAKPLQMQPVVQQPVVQQRQSQAYQYPVNVSHTPVVQQPVVQQSQIHASQQYGSAFASANPANASQQYGSAFGNANPANASQQYGSAFASANPANASQQY